jgi:hypothetical protein
MEYYDEIEKKCGIILEEKENMKKFNQVRSSFKHKGLIISKSEIEIARVNVLNFFKQNTLLVFKIEFDSLSLSEYVSYEPARDYLKLAESNFNEKNYNSAIQNISMAFELIVNDYVREKLGERFFVEGDPYSSLFSKKLNLSQTFYNRSIPENVFNYLNKLNEYSKDLERQIHAMKDTLKYNTLNIDYKKYIKFRRIAQKPIRSLGGGPPMFTTSERQFTKEEYQFCMDFTLESAIKIQELEFNFQ